jgi:hypothetical protein
VERYWRRVLKGAWDKTVPAGWNRHKIAAAIIPVIGALLAGGTISGAWNITGLTLGGLIGLAIVLPVLFLWGVIETQAELYRAKSQSDDAATRERPPKPDYDKWRHVPKISLKTAAQLWTAQRPQMGIFGEAMETYAMLRGAIQKGELVFEAEASIAPHMRDTQLQLAFLRIISQYLLLSAKRFTGDSGNTFLSVWR